MLEELREQLTALEGEVSAGMDVALKEAQKLLRRGGVCTRLAHELRKHHVDIASAFVAELQHYIKTNVSVLLKPLPADSTAAVAGPETRTPDADARVAVAEVAGQMQEMKELFIDMTLATDECKQMLANDAPLEHPLPPSLVGPNAPSNQQARAVFGHARAEQRSSAQLSAVCVRCRAVRCGVLCLLVC